MHDFTEKLQNFNDISALELTASIRSGWNLGDTLDCHDAEWLQEGFFPSVAEMETAWDNPQAAFELIKKIKDAGFDAIRIPVSWTKCADKNYIIRKDWLERVKEVVNYAFACDMYVIIDSHHDENVFTLLDRNMDESKKAFVKIWEQIADNFKNYNEKLIFEGMNEPRTIGSKKEWDGGTEEERNNLNMYMQLFVDTVRRSGGNNAKRLLLVTPYAASDDEKAMEALRIPEDSAKNKLIVSIHAYNPYNFALNVKSPVNKWSIDNKKDTLAITDTIDRAYRLFVKKGVPVIIGEFGAINKDNLQDRIQWAKFYVNYAREKNIPCFWWDSGDFEKKDESSATELFGIIDRRTNEFVFPEIVRALINRKE